MASYKHRQNLVDLLNQIQVPIITTSQDLNAMIGSINRELTISYSDKEGEAPQRLVAYHYRCQKEEDTNSLDR